MLPFRALRLIPTRAVGSSSLKMLTSSRLQSTISTTPKSVDPLLNTETKPERKPVTVDRELPNPLKDRNWNRIQFVGFWIVMGIASVLMFNYEKVNSPIVTTTLHFLRRSHVIREVLGDEIDFSSIYPWISGQLNQVQGKVNIEFEVKGSKKLGKVRLIADREDRHQEFLIHEWSLTVDGKKFDLLADDTVDFAV